MNINMHENTVVESYTYVCKYLWSCVFESQTTLTKSNLKF